MGAVSGAVISPIVFPPVSSRAGDRRAVPDSGVRSSFRPLPLAEVPVRRSTATVYGLAAVDGRGRIADRAIMQALGWAPGTSLDMRLVHGVVVIHAETSGPFRVTSQGHLRLPVSLRHGCALEAGDRVLLAADLAEGSLVVHSPAALDAMVAQFRASVLGGDRA